MGAFETDLPLLGALPVGVFTVDLDGRCTFANRFWEGFLGRPAAELLGFGYLESVYPEDRAKLEERWPAIVARGEAYRMEYRFVTAGGTIRWALMEGRPMRDPGGALTGFVGALTDIEDQKRAARLETQLRHAQKMEALGTLAGGVAHDFNNLLAAVLTSLQVALAKGELQPPIAETLRIAMNAAEQASGLARQLLTLSDRRPPQRHPTDVNGVVEQSLALLRGSLPAGVRLEVSLDESLGVVQMDATQLAQALVNLLINARDALGERGTIHVSTRRATIDEVGEVVIVTVRDDGSGIAPEALPHLFEPFFTTKTGKGTGLGLAMVNALAVSHGGWVDVESVPGEGSRFEIVLPRVPARPSQLDPLLLQAHRGEEHVALLCGHELRADARAALEAAGYRVTPVEDVEEALAVPDAAAFVAELLGGARELLARLRQQGRAEPVVVAATHADAVAGFAAVVDIPVEPQTLTAAVRAAIDACPQRAEPSSGRNAHPAPA